MPRIHQLNRHVEFDSLQAIATNSGETNDCAVKAVCAATGEEYGKVHAIFAECGRRNRRGTPGWITQCVMDKLGYKLTYIEPMTKIQQYPGIHGRVLRSVTTHHPDRFPEVWRDGKTYLFNTPGHILCVKDGRNLDWTRGRAKRVKSIREVTKKVS